MVSLLGKWRNERCTEAMGDAEDQADRSRFKTRSAEKLREITAAVFAIEQSACKRVVNFWGDFAIRKSRGNTCRFKARNKSARVAAHVFALSQNVPFHGGLEFLFGGVGFEIDGGGERVELEEIAMWLASRRARTVVASFLEIVKALTRTISGLRSFREILRKRAEAWREVIGDPVDPVAYGGRRGRRRSARKILYPRADRSTRAREKCPRLRR